MKPLIPFSILIGFALLVLGCEEKQPELVEHIRAVKVFTVSESAGGNIRKFSGQLAASNSASLSFPIAGTVKEVSVVVGDKVTTGQVLALLDDVPFQLDVEAAEAELRKVQSAANEKVEDYKRNKSLFDKGWVSKAALEQAQYAKETALEDVHYKTTSLNQARRSLGDAKLLAPYDGVVGERFVEPNEEIASGAQALKLDGDGALEISISVSEKLISKINMGMPATVTLNVLSGMRVEGRVTEISRVAGAGNAFPVKVSLTTPPEELRAGMSGEVSLLTSNGEQDSGYLIPLTAITVGEGLKGSAVFIFDQTTSSLKRVKIIPSSVREYFVAVKGVKPGDQVVSAGVSFLSDGQKVKLMASAGSQ